MKKKTNRSNKTFAIAAAAGAAAVAVTMFAAYRSTVNRLVPTSTSAPAESRQTFTFSAPESSDVPVQNNVTGIPKPDGTSSGTSSENRPGSTSSTVPANKPIIADVGNIMPVKGEVSHKFSNGELVKSETLGVWKTHDGCDILCDLGTEVRSMSEGMVKEIKDDPLWGIYVIVEQNNGLDVQYCGLAKELNVKAGQTVKQGEILGKTSDTNQCEIVQQPHLHLGVKQGGKWIDPLSVIDSQE